MSGDRRRDDDQPFSVPTEEKGLDEDTLGEGLIDLPPEPEGVARDDAPAHHLEDEAAAEVLLLGDEEEASVRDEGDDLPFELEDDALDAMEGETPAIDARDDREGPVDDLDDDLSIGTPDLSNTSDEEGPSEEGLELGGLPPLPPLDAADGEEEGALDLEEEDLLDLPEGEDPAPRRRGRREGGWDARST